MDDARLTTLEARVVNIERMLFFLMGLLPVEVYQLMTG